jgi:hypothetical protein
MQMIVGKTLANACITSVVDTEYMRYCQFSAEVGRIRGGNH